MKTTFKIFGLKVQQIIRSFWLTSDGIKNETELVVTRHHQIEKDTIVWYRDAVHHPWFNGYYSHFEDGRHYVYCVSKKSTESKSSNWWNIVTTKNPLI